MRVYAVSSWTNGHCYLHGSIDMRGAHVRVLQVRVLFRLACGEDHYRVKAMHLETTRDRVFTEVSVP